MAYEHNHINRYNKDEKKKSVAFTVETSDIGDEVDEYQSEGMTLINRGVKQLLRKRRQRRQQEFNFNKIQKK